MLIEKITQLLEEKIREDYIGYFDVDELNEVVEAHLDLIVQRIVTCFGGRE